MKDFLEGYNRKENTYLDEEIRLEKTGIELERKEIIKSLLDKYEIVAFESTHPTYIPGTNYTEGGDFQGMILKEKGNKDK